ncbi:MAG: T9SS type A sorting domain-containing protein [Bacteroidetes bacterium]|nr:MAG: T9SS type A sorting domain-containing protein [Bacteroidota bacterium]
MKRYILFFYFLISVLTANSQGVNLSLSSSSLNIIVNESDTTSLSIQAFGGFNQQVILTYACLTGNCNGLSISFNQSVLTYPYTNGAILTVSVTGNCVPGQYLFSIIGANGPVSATETLTINVFPDPCQINSINHFLPNNTRAIWVGNTNIWLSDGFELNKFNRSSWTTYTTTNSQLPGFVWDMTGDLNENIWLATSAGIAKFDGTFWTIYNSSNSGLTANYCSSIAIDSLNNIWIGSGEQGDFYYRRGALTKFDGSTWTTFDSLNSPLPSNSIQELSIDRNGILWFSVHSYSTNSHQIGKFDGTNWTFYSPLDFCVPNAKYISKVRVDSLGYAWFGIVDKCYNPNTVRGLVRTDWNTWEIWMDSTTVPFNHFIYDSSCNPILQDRSSVLPPYGVGRIVIDDKDVVWAPSSKVCGGGNGLTRVQNGNFKIFNTTNSLLFGKSVCSLYSFKDTVWIVSTNDYQSGASDKLQYFTCTSIINNIPDHQLNDGIKVFPNPAINQFTVFVDLIYNLEPFLLSVFDLSGKRIFSREIHTGSNIIMTDDLFAGFYFYKVQTNRSSYSGKLVIEN